MGFPKTVEDLSISRADAQVCFTMATDGQPEVRICFPEGDGAASAGRIETTSYSYLHGVGHETPLAMDLGAGVIDPSTVEIELGSGEVADELRSLGLPKDPDSATWGTGLTATFHLGRPVARAVA